ncbi:MAG: hypothetical protein ACLRJV_15955 [Eubacteriales bacterium]
MNLKTLSSVVPSRESVTAAEPMTGASRPGSHQGYCPGVVVTGQTFVKIRLLPVNFYTMSSMDKSAAIEDFAAYLKIAPANLQINVLTQPLT